ncbi:unnamed protein product [Moneuplotes crassus]|uniref:Cyclic nucleotide-binding domain-containing protein n=1 Tax=Euplotes crassus TaxID=5936 RepID=A0AAD1U3H5_EUPCR|nr:unnamed protein product [Moneuplotes crassus]
MQQEGEIDNLDDFDQDEGETENWNDNLQTEQMFPPEINGFESELQNTERKIIGGRKSDKSSKLNKKKVAPHENSPELSSAHQSELTKSKKNINSNSKGSKMSKSLLTSSLHTKNNPSEDQLLPVSRKANKEEKCKRPDSNLRRSRAILPCKFGETGMISQTPQGFSLKKFMEENEKKNNEVTQKIEAEKLSTESDDDPDLDLSSKRFLCRVHDKKRIRWDLFIMLCAIWNSIQIPYSIAFSPDSDAGAFNIAVNLIMDSFFIVDIIFNFRTTYLDQESGIEVGSSNKICLQYIKGRFWIDLVSSLPTDIILLAFNPSSNIETTLILLKLLKLIRLTRLSRVITYLNFKSNVKMSLRLFQLIFFLLLYFHLIACFWFYIARDNKRWIPPYDENNENSDIYESGSFSQYLTSIYYSILLLAGNDMMPQGEQQIIFLSIALFAAAIINANIFGNIAVLLQQIYRKSAQFQEKVENATSTMKNLNVPENLSKRIQEYLTETQSTLDQQTEFDNFLNILSPSLRIEVTKHIFHESLLSMEVFDKNEDVINLIIHDLHTVLYFPENEICRQGSYGKELYFLAKGEVDVFVRDENQQNKFIQTLNPGEYFGEVALLKDCARTATVRSQGYSTCASLDSQTFEKLLDTYSFVKKTMEKKIHEKYQDRWRKFVKRSLRNVEFLEQKVPEDLIEELSYKMQFKNISKTDYLFKSGTPCRSIIIIVSGRVEILIMNNNNGNESYLDTLYSGCTIGSYSVLNNDDYCTSCKALTDVTYLTLDFTVLEQLRVIFEELDDNMCEYEDYIENHQLPYCDYKLHRGIDWDITPIQKFQNGINRIIRIVKSYKSNTFTNLLKKVQDRIKKERNLKIKRVKNKIIKANPQNFEEKMEKLILEQSIQLQKLTEIVTKQTTEITKLQKYQHYQCNTCGTINGMDNSDMRMSAVHHVGISKTPQLLKRQSITQERSGSYSHKRLEAIRETSNSKRRHTSNNQINKLIFNNKKKNDSINRVQEPSSDNSLTSFKNLGDPEDFNEIKNLISPPIEGSSKFQIHEKDNQQINDDNPSESKIIKPEGILSNPSSLTKSRLRTSLRPDSHNEISVEVPEEEESISSDKSIKKTHQKKQDGPELPILGSGLQSINSKNKSERRNPAVAMNAEDEAMKIFSSFNSDVQRVNHETDSFREIFSTPEPKD